MNISGHHNQLRASCTDRKKRPVIRHADPLMHSFLDGAAQLGLISSLARGNDIILGDHIGRSHWNFRDHFGKSHWEIVIIKEIILGDNIVR